MTSPFVKWSQMAATSPARWTKPKPKVRVTVKLMAAVAGQHVVKIEPGEPTAITGINRTSITFPDPFDDDEHLTDACRAFIISTVRDTVQRDGRMRWITWPEGSSIAVTRDGLTPVLPLARHRPQPILVEAEPRIHKRNPSALH